MDLGLDGRTALVTGGGRGIGYAISALLLAEGAKVAVADIDAEGAQEAAAKLGAAGGTVVAITGDVSDHASSVAMVAEAERTIGPLDVLVNNAGMWIVKPFTETGPQDWAREFGVNTHGVLNMTHAALPGMIERRRGSVVTITSEAGRVGEPRTAVYSAAKAAVIGFSKALAKEVGRHGVRVNCVALGTTRTPQAEASFAPELWDRIAKAYPLGRTGEPEDAAAAVAFLAGDCASWVTGQTYGVNGGYAMP
ncbi:SDR family oxidoreductase [Pseudonocardia sp. KRD-184]|uniref:SDR family oxidoreductase n=1 Tax=Pseudonocardia oceani TaxID=2792013 RepID=A0ABS6U2W1_9PSEU|nr:SDR family oxidoreductase [Pseudonocardia oceani]MBW0091564.1 SDR family oxidoreductase [Pseudonocardia oceani]MBW0095633.1 SDR family oxidoreductase [Pseudonocardia oceani]MBW0107855.1 SDR family oxidoreductase [Pseudonocardia oceani]MBW0122230.1 SDR family oxidoreductase [Pseudonocardia oceani]MBW0126326.1 SDR family oxidoreductase [Pseudonocardia oceani]